MTHSATRFAYTLYRGLPISAALHNDLHWLDVSERINYKLDVTVHRFLAGESSEVPGRLLHSSFGSRRTFTTTLSQSTTPYCATALKEKERKGKWTCIATIVSTSNTKRLDVDHTQLPANTPHLPYRLRTFGCLSAFSVAGPTAWNSLLDRLQGRS